MRAKSTVIRNGAGRWRAPPCPRDTRNLEGIPAHEILGISQGKSFRKWWVENELTFQGTLWRSLSPLSSWLLYTTSHLAAGLSSIGSREQDKPRRSGCSQATPWTERGQRYLKVWSSSNLPINKASFLGGFQAGTYRHSQSPLLRTAYRKEKSN